MKKKTLLITCNCIALLFFITNSWAQTKGKPAVSKPMLRFICSTIEPKSAGLPKDTASTRAMADNYYLWDNGKKLTVKFISGGSPALREKIKRAAKGWEQYANITFNFVRDDEEAHIRVLLTDKGGCKSQLGTNASSVSPTEKTMNIDTNFFYSKGVCYDNYLQQTIQHEFGHSIGLLHEHFYKGKIQWNKSVVYAEAMRTNEWDSATVDYQILRPVSELYTNGFFYDPKSIMHYGFPASWTLNNVEIKPNFSISPGDIQTVGFLYPKNASTRTNEFPRFEISNLTATKVVKNTEKKGLSIFPSFNLSTAGRNGKILIIAYLLDEKSNLVINKSNPKSYVGVVKGGDLKPGLKFAINKTELDYELFIPYTDIPDNVTNYKVLLVIKLVDDVNQETKILARDLVAYSAMK